MPFESLRIGVVTGGRGRPRRGVPPDGTGTRRTLPRLGVPDDGYVAFVDAVEAALEN